nr:hypothetical protein [Tanacetum cinerariifolium]
MYEAKQMKVITKRSKTYYHVSHPSGSGAHEGIGVTLGVPDVPTYGSEDEQISWKSSDDENRDEVSENADNEDDDDHDDDNANTEDDDGQDDDNEQTESDNDGDDFVHPNLSTFDEEERHEEKLDEEEEGSDQGFHTLLILNPLMIKHMIKLSKSFRRRLYGIVDKYLANQMNEAVKAAVQLQSDRLREEAHDENKDFINKIDENIKQIIKEQVKVQVKEQVSKILPRIEKSLNKMENNKSIHRLVQQKSLYKALVDAYESDKDILATYGYTVTIKRRRDDDEEPYARSNWGSKRRRAGKEPESSSKPKENSSKLTSKSKEGSKSHQTGLIFELMKGSCKSLVELEYFHEEVCKATTDQLDWNNPKGQQYPHDLCKPLPLIPNLRGRRVIPFDHFINNDLAYLSGGVSSQTYDTLVTNTKAVDLQLGVESYQKKLNLTKPDTYRSDLKRKEPYIAYSTPRGFIYQNEDKKNRLMRIDELYKFSDGTLNDVRSALDDTLKKIQMNYSPQTI